MTKWIIRLLAVWGLLTTTLITIEIQGDRVGQAIMGMTWGLILIWIVIGGGLMYRFREPIHRRVLAIGVHWAVKFIAFATLLALLEEAVTTGMTNLAPVFGVNVGEAAITASPNYFEVVLLHSVIVFVPMFFAWAWMLSRFAFTPAQVFLLFGLNGVLAETISFGFQNLFSIGLWVFVYGLMIYLPAYSLPALAGRHTPRFYHFLLALILPIAAASPVGILILTLRG